MEGEKYEKVIRSGLGDPFEFLKKFSDQISAFSTIPSNPSLPIHVYFP